MNSKTGSRKLEAGSARFYRIRRRVYGGLLLFVVVAGLPLVTVPALRDRLFTRVRVLKTAFTGETNPVMVQTSENQEPFPAEYERQAPPAVAQVLKMPSSPVVHSEPQKEEPRVRSAPRRTLKIPQVDKTSSSAEEGAESGEQSQSAQAIESANQPKYQQGTMEQEAYDLLLKSSPAIEKLIQGSDPSLKFLSWDAAGRGDDIYWVRLKFRSEGKPDVEYIWQVQLQSKRVTPLNYNARTLS